ncbi:Os04g0627132 [Oryza sativa Japonica Group]|uniref:Os04g0627132 protein n=1 Tax=Oryza sativa subsp. japonica TaxID=39947 RepID=A0A0P0WFC6_ORYSJ|nr:hypothetical protein EE612_025700 [Oryza sativa]BAS91128.1 Os04g0627132 [Oryza sativa Japonica Group]
MSCVFTREVSSGGRSGGGNADQFCLKEILTESGKIRRKPKTKTSLLLRFDGRGVAVPGPANMHVVLHGEEDGVGSWFLLHGRQRQIEIDLHICYEIGRQIKAAAAAATIYGSELDHVAL